MDWRGQLISVILAFILGVIVAWQGCNSEPQTLIIEKPVPKIEYVDRWKHDTVRHVTTKVITVTDTIHDTRIVNRLDTLFLIDTVKIVEAWLSEVVQYDTTAPVGGGVLSLRWQNYQNLTENLRIDYKPKVAGAKFALGVHGNVGLLSDFNTRYTPLMGVGLQVTVKKTYISANYGYNGQHYVGVGVGRTIISR
jgi:hypothetical protein